MCSCGWILCRRLVDEPGDAMSPAGNGPIVKLGAMLSRPFGSLWQPRMPMGRESMGKPSSPILMLSRPASFRDGIRLR
jgi:hypothetical protein